MTRLVHHARDLPAAAAVVMTMGALHEGHAALIRAARAHAGDGLVTVTVFVNPLQFGPNEDLDRYPRTLDADVELAGQAGADVVFAPGTDEVYPGGQPRVRIAAGPMGTGYEGASRPGHLTRPAAAFFGQKDAQQLALIRRMATDLNFPVDIVAVPTVREDDGLALSSRNRYLTAQDRTHALALSRALFAGRDAAPDGPEAVRKAARAALAAADGLAVDYLALVDPADFTEAAPDHTGPAVLAVAAKVGTTRLIDNIPLEFGAAE
jgi:pantoate--beta-alanine ligase